MQSSWKSKCSFLPFPVQLTKLVRRENLSTLDARWHITSLILLWKDLDNPASKTAKTHSALQQVERCPPRLTPEWWKYSVAQFPSLCRCWEHISETPAGSLNCVELWILADWHWIVFVGRLTLTGWAWFRLWISTEAYIAWPVHWKQSNSSKFLNFCHNVFDTSLSLWRSGASSFSWCC